MKSLNNFIISIIIAGWIILIAVFSIQNITEVSLKFLLFESIKLPIGIMLSFMAGFGFIFGSFLPLLLSQKVPKQIPSKRRPIFKQETESEEEDPLFDWD